MTMLFTGGTVVTMDPALGDLARGDVLIDGDRIAAVGPDLREHPLARGASIVDTTGRIVSPGFVDTHRHAWQAQFRRSIPDVTDLGAYVTNTLARIAPAYCPHDVYVGTRLAALSALDAGITTMLDFSHNSRSAAHSDAAIQALLDTGIRGVHASMAPHFGDWDGQWPKDVERLHAAHSSGLVSVRLATLATGEISGPLLAYGPQLALVSRYLGIGVSVDAVFGESSSTAIVDWARAGLLGPHVTLIHATGLTPEAWRAIGDTGTTISLAPTSDAQIGLETAIPAVDEALAVGVRPGLSIDVEVALASDMFTQMRALHTIQRMRAVNAAYGTDAVPNRITTRDMLDFATLQGAHTNGLGAVTGSLTPGKQADLLVVNASDINTMPLNDAVGTLVLGADPRNIETVLVAGVIRKSAGRLVGVDVSRLHEEVLASRDAVLAAVSS
ncbi:amidohydrolase family protein [Actinoplanes couchii]|uniref:Cytosine deaminase n=1 Tax=Actinoplanes couchii TaxID=403638 RepID=A0ABQ3X8F4_9ACTN|nr:amidohydrolase family protein [Actinoplanes couchii]MDR6320201.1 cytosine/adenosine deaminase-related metal-dependent hydrolase [Actinoplanes couchii]GID54785.1 cytosine deaminase [Actinoplanes couchii]